ncbi:HEAT repeat domain-containing protein [Methanoplanus endosymbiosus]|uniref:HEAT repeat domain-containing protein n=1 Tax=Methanoplanus endosymbiosus TaxID=33865 RepID=A0A9E7PPM0_9EURY|nr:HEAT repeat domain-containing protein [Methanoplanus endosymbiosus]UUX91297.1 HEAT repeat domain-containing protein [Methanoplanus endosymbiosus]
MSDEITGLLELLDSGSRGEKKKAIKRLKEIGKKGAIPLLKALNSGSETMRSGAAEVLGSYSGDNIGTFVSLLITGQDNARDGAARTIAQISAEGGDIIGPLSGIINDKRPKARQGVALTLGYLVNPNVSHKNMLVSLLKDSDKSVRERAVKSLDNIGWDSQNPVEKSFYHLSAGNWEELGKMGRPALNALSFGAEDPDPHFRQKVAHTLAKVNEAGSVPLLCRLLLDKDPSVRQSAIESACDKGDAALIPHIIRALDDPEFDVRVEASWSLEKIGWRPPDSYLKTKSLMVRGSYNDVAKMGRYALPCLIDLLGDKSPIIKENTLKTLYSIGKPAYAAIGEAKRSGKPEVRRGAADAVRYFNEEDRRAEDNEALELLKKESEILDLNSPEYWEELLKKSGFSVINSRKIAQALASNDPVIRIVAVESLKRYGKKSVDALLKLLKDDKSSVKVVAVEALGDLQSDEAITVFFDTIEDENPSVRRATAYALGKLRKKETIPILIRHFADPDDGVRDECSESVAKMGNNALTFLENMIFTPDENVRICSLKAISGISDPSGILPVTRSLNDPQLNVRNQAMAGLLRISNFMFNYLMNEVRRVSIQGTKMEKLGMLSVLSKIDDLRVISYVRGFIKDSDEEVRRNAGTILEIFRQREIKRELSKFSEKSRETAGLIRRKLSVSEIDRLLDQLLGADDEDALKILDRKLRQDEIDELIRGAGSDRSGKTGELLGKKLSQDEIDELIHRSVYAESKKTTELLGNRLSQDEIDELIKNASSEKDEKAAKDIKKQLTQNEIDDIIRKELELKKKISMEISRLVIGLKSDDKKRRKATSERIIGMGEPAVEPLLNTMISADDDLREIIAGILPEFGEPGISGLMRYLNYGSPEIKILAAEKLSGTGSRVASNVIFDRIFVEKETPVRVALIYALYKLGHRKILDALTHALKDNNPEVNSAAVEILGKIDDERAIPLLISLFGSKSSKIRGPAVISLKKYGSKAGPELLSALKGDENDLLKETAASAMRDLSIIPEDLTDKSYYLAALGEWKELERSGSAALPAMKNIMENPYSGRRKEALEFIISSGGPDFYSLLVYALYDVDDSISARAEEAVLRKGAVLLPALRRAEGERSDPDETERLNRIIRKTEFRQKFRSLFSEGKWHGIEEMGRPALKELIVILKGHNPDARRQAARIIGNIGGNDALSILSVESADDDPVVSETACTFLIRSGGKSLPYIQKAAGKVQNEKKKQKMNDLYEFISRRENITELIADNDWAEVEKAGSYAVRYLISYVGEEDAPGRISAVKSIFSIGGEESVQALAGLALSTDPEVSETAAGFLLESGSEIIPVLEGYADDLKDNNSRDVIELLIERIKNSENNQD